MNQSIIFGDVFEFDGKEYIFLGNKNDIYYCALILPTKESKHLHRSLESRLSRADIEVTRNPSYCYVILTTEDFSERMAHLKNSGKNAFSLTVNPLNKSIDKKDLQEIKKQILEHQSIPQGLRSIVKDINI